MNDLFESIDALLAESSEDVVFGELRSIMERSQFSFGDLIDFLDSVDVDEQYFEDVIRPYAEQKMRTKSASDKAISIKNFLAANVLKNKTRGAKFLLDHVESFSNSTKDLVFGFGHESTMFGGMFMDFNERNLTSIFSHKIWENAGLSKIEGKVMEVEPYVNPVIAAGINKAARGADVFRWNTEDEGIPSNMSILYHMGFTNNVDNVANVRKINVSAKYNNLDDLLEHAAAVYRKRFGFSVIRLYLDDRYSISRSRAHAALLELASDLGVVGQLISISGMDT